MDVLTQIWHRALGTQPEPSREIIAGAAVVAAVLVLVPSLWRYTRHLVTIAHEGAHGVAALITGRRLTGIRLHSDTSGLTLSRGRARGPGMVLTAFAGYVGPALIGLGAAVLLSGGRAVGLLWLVLLMLALLVLQIRNWFGLLSVLATGVVVFAVSWWTPATAQSAFAYLVTWLLLIAAPRPVLELQRSRRRGRARTSDADQLARLTPLPGLVWVGVFLGVTVGALILGALLLLTLR
ncbi:MAG: conserved rane protein of unknown function [Pseudonocardiales bacterium]|nr:conserved rane protein of unknown function [Pseudonocardiales bacterium]